MATKSISIHFSWYFNCSVLELILISSATGTRRPYISSTLLKHYKDENSPLLPGKLADGLNVLRFKRYNLPFFKASMKKLMLSKDRFTKFNKCMKERLEQHFCDNNVHFQVGKGLTIQFVIVVYSRS